jgi:hypothetical protein
MSNLKLVIYMAAGDIFIICLYAFLSGMKVFTGKIENNYIAWYFLAKGIFCSLTLYLLVRILDVLSEKQNRKDLKW